MKNSIAKSTNQLITFFIIAFSFSWFFWLFAVLDGMKVIVLPFSYFVPCFIGAHGPLVAALVMTGRVEGKPGLKSLLTAGFRWRISLIWWLAILILPALLGGLALWINVSLNDFQFDKSLIAQPWMIPIMYLAMFFVGGSFQEEFGWRGYALPRLLEKWNPLMGTLILGAVWGVWHLPLFFIPETGQYFMPLGVFLILVEAFSFLITWAYLRTDRNLFSALLFHTSINAILSIFPPIEKIAGGNQMGFIYLTVAYIVVVAVLIVKERTLWFNEQPKASPTLTLQAK